jgi:hypothetical protein
MAALVTPEELANALDWPDASDTSDLDQVCDSADTIVRRYLDPNLGPHDIHAHDKEAALAVAVQIYTSRRAPGGTMQAIDFQPIVTPNLLGPGLVARIQGLIGPCRKYGGMTVA